MTLKMTTTKAPVGTPTWTREPPRAEIRKPATTAVIKPLSGEAPLAMPKAMASGSATIATVSPAIASALKVLTERSEEHTSELQSLMRISYAVFCLKKKNNLQKKHRQRTQIRI